MREKKATYNHSDEAHGYKHDAVPITTQSHK